ncbi:MAG TPA: hypothetical protein VJ999_10560 [Candidatus Sulfotelmatobacter sp.]|nr:hypothetical protein [Candidatus Sulfotelmatobacter sp.]
MKYQHRVLGMLWLLAVITYLDRVCVSVAGKQRSFRYFRSGPWLHVGAIAATTTPRSSRW